jgi:hypothetical protein
MDLFNERCERYTSVSVLCRFTVDFVGGCGGRVLTKQCAIEIVARHIVDVRLEIDQILL